MRACALIVNRWRTETPRNRQSRLAPARVSTASRRCRMGSSRSVVLAAPVRTALGTFGGSLKEVPASDLGAAAIGASVARAGLRPEEIGTVVMGNVIQAGSKMNPARQAAIHARLPVS